MRLFVYVSISLIGPWSVFISSYYPRVLSTALCTQWASITCYLDTYFSYLRGRKVLPPLFHAWRSALKSSTCLRTDATWEESWRQFCRCFTFVKSCSWASHVRHDTVPHKNPQEYRDAVHIGIYSSPCGFIVRQPRTFHLRPNFISWTHVSEAW